METRELKGLHLAATANIQRRGATWIVPSGRTYKKYTVRITSAIQSCTCPDYEATHRPCKHIYAVRQILNPQPQPVDSPPQPIPRPTYRQEWREYNLAQTREKSHIQELLYALCSGIETPEYKFGRPRLPLAEMLFSLAMKVYCGFSSRRTISDLRAAQMRGYLSHTPHFCSLAKYMEAAWITPYLQRLITESALPLKAVETAFAVDSSGFSINRYDRWTTTKYGGDPRLMEKQAWIKLHLICGVVTNVVTSCEITEKYANDSPQFPVLVSDTAKNFNLREVSGDKAYSSRDNLKLVKGYGATPYIDFKVNATDAATKDALWRRMYHFYAYNQDWFARHYHKRSNVESTFSMIKAKFGGSLRSKTYPAQVNEALCKVLCHNLCCLIQSIYEMGIEPEFWT